ncbi:hypothetical protein TNCV_2001761 [Trichonephila clavipes]|nr:hypothetical protein TNCV_2001761 [Trichonephila clavipes]
MFSDKSSTSVTNDSDQQLLCSESGTRYVLKFVCERDQDAFGRRVAQKTIPPSKSKSSSSLELGVGQYPQEFLDSLEKNMDSRCKMYISARGQHTFYKDTHVCIILT